MKKSSTERAVVLVTKPQARRLITERTGRFVSERVIDQIIATGVLGSPVQYHPAGRQMVSRDLVERYVATLVEAVAA
jgi:hypothetical protein